MVELRWKIADRGGAEVDELARALGCTPLLARLLCLRGIDEVETARLFLYPKLASLHDPFGLPDMEKAVARVDAAIRKRQAVAVFGDYDVDGITSTALLYEFFRFIGFPVTCRLPNRLTDGYGLRPAAVEELAARGVELIITVDNGVGAVDAIRRAENLGMEVVVLDHHQPSPILPPAAAIVNPWLPSSTYPFKDLAGVGVTFKFVWALAQRFSRRTKLSTEFRRFLVDSLGLVALGTIADVVPLRGENRLFAKFGLAFLMETRRPGLRQLVKIALGDRSERKLEARDVGYRIGPVLNAAGRLGQAEKGLALLLAQDESEASRIGAFLERQNEQRKAIEKAICTEARALVEKTIDLEEDRAIVLGAHGWHAGVIGIVASRITEEFFRPTVLVSFDGDRGRGSARSIPGVHISRALSDCDDCLLSHGGHEMAAGVEMVRERMEDLRLGLNRAINIEPGRMVPNIEADAVVELRELSLTGVDELALMQPYGTENPEPLFLLEDLEVIGSPRIMGRSGEHLSFHVRQGGVVQRAVAFGKADVHDRLARPGARVSLLVVPELSTWRNRTAVELRVRELRCH